MVEERRCSSRDGFPLAVQTSGPADAPALLLLQGQANSHHWWDGLRGQFESYRTITFDYRGTGRSRGPVGRWTTATFADDAAEVLDLLAVDSAAVYGTSMGGRVAQMLAVRHPERVTALVLACTSPGGPHAVEGGPHIRGALARATGLERVRILRDLFYTPGYPHSHETSPLFGDQTMTAQEATAHLRASTGHDAWDALPSIAVPTLVLHGAEDQLNPVDNASLLADRVPGAELRVYPEGRHGFFDELSSTVNPTVLHFLAMHGVA